MNVSLLKYIMEEKEVTKKDLAEAIGVQYNAMCKRLSGKIEFKRDEIRDVMTYLNLTDEQTINIFFKSKSS